MRQKNHFKLLIGIGALLALILTFTPTRAGLVTPATWSAAGENGNLGGPCIHQAGENFTSLVRAGVIDKNKRNIGKKITAAEKFIRLDSSGLVKTGNNYCCFSHIVHSDSPGINNPCLAAKYKILLSSSSMRSTPLVKKKGYCHFPTPEYVWLLPAKIFSARTAIARLGRREENMYPVASGCNWALCRVCCNFFLL